MFEKVLEVILEHKYKQSDISETNSMKTIDKSQCSSLPGPGIKPALSAPDSFILPLVH